MGSGVLCTGLFAALVIGVAAAPDSWAADQGRPGFRIAPDAAVAPAAR